jgi:hypothetical protein
MWPDSYSVLVTRFDADGWSQGETVGWLSGDSRRSLDAFLAEVVHLPDAEAAQLAAALIPAWQRRQA